MYIDELRKSKNKPQVAFHEFALATGTRQNHLFCFFEGKDNAYYVPRIKRFTNDYYPIKCGCKDAVLSVYTLIVNKSEYKKYKLGFFIDRDFDEPIGAKAPPIFETPCYSIENLYVSLYVFEDILTNEFHLSEITDKQLFDDLLNLYEMRQKEFHSSILLLNAWYSCLIDKKNKEGIKIDVDFKNLTLNKFISINIHNVTQNYDLQSLNDKFPNAIEIDEATLNQKIELFKSVEQHKVFRGKYEMEFLLKIIKGILLDSYKTKSIIKDKIKFSFGDGSTLNQEQLLNIFEAYAETPQTLTDYIKTITKEITTC
jgi:hypothetical protein